MHVLLGLVRAVLDHTFELFKAVYRNPSAALYSVLYFRPALRQDALYPVRHVFYLPLKVLAHLAHSLIIGESRSRPKSQRPQRNRHAKPPRQWVSFIQTGHFSLPP